MSRDSGVGLHLGIEAHEEALRSAGFRGVTWHRPRLSPGGVAEEDGYWSPLLDHPPVIFLDCVK